MKGIKFLGAMALSAVAVVSLASCGTPTSSESNVSGSGASGSVSVAKKGWTKDTPAETIIKEAAQAGKVGNWGLGNEFEIQALLQKYNQPTSYISQPFTMDCFDDDTVTLASAMTYNELGLVKNSYEGALGYGDTVGIIDMNSEGVAMLEDNIFCTKAYAESNPNTVKAFVYASMKGWEYACAHPEEAAQIVYEAGSSVSSDHQLYMAKEVAKLVTIDTAGNTVKVDGTMVDSALQQTIDQAKKYIKLDDATAAAKLQATTLDDIRDSQYVEASKTFDTDSAAKAAVKAGIEDKNIKIQLKWLPQSQFMGYYVAQAMGYYTEMGFESVEIVPGGGDIPETVAVSNSTVDFGVTWVSNLISANAAGSGLLQVAQVYQKSGLVLVYKYAE